MSAVADKPDRLVVQLGNPRPHQQVERDGRRVAIPHPFLQQSITRVNMWGGIDDPKAVEHTLSTDNDRVLVGIAAQLGTEFRKYAVALREIEDILVPHAGGAKPTWVDCNDPHLAKAIAKLYGCHIGQPQALITNVGRDGIHHQNFDTAAPPAQFNYVALTASTATPLATNTTVPGEITTAGGGLLRAQGTFAHTTGTNTSTLTRTFTANGSDALPVTLAQIGVLNAVTVGTLGFHTALTSTITLNVSGDSITVTETLTAG